MPRANSTGVDSVDQPDETIAAVNAATANTTRDESADAEPVKDPAPVRRRRVGRRVVRGAGAAGAALALKVEEVATPIFEEPHIVSDAETAAGETTTASKADSDDRSDRDEAAQTTPKTRIDKEGASRRTRTAASRTRVRRRQGESSEEPSEGDDQAAETSQSSEVFDEAPKTVRRTRSRRVSRQESAPIEHDADRAADVVEALPAGHEARHNPRPMTSLLFQEPVLPVAGADADERSRNSDDDEDSEQTEAGSHVTRRTRSRRGHTHDEDAEGDERDGSARVRRRRNSHNETRDEDRNEGHDENGGEARDEREARTDESEAATGRSGRSRRLNAQERRAAGEVEQIEEDLEYDSISYRPIDDDDEGLSTRSRRRRRSRADRDDARREDAAQRERGNGRDNDERDDEENRGEHMQMRRRRRSEDESESTTLTRRRRRRRGQRDAEDGDERQTARRSRKQQYIDEITDVEGSTRLEAKKQRRRDNRRERSRQGQLMEQDFLARRENVERLMVVRERERHTQISVIEDNVLVEHYVSDIQEVATVGNIYLGRVQNVLPSMEAAFVDIGQARNGVLYAGEVNWDSTRLEGQPRRIELAYRSGDPVLVQVTKDPIGHKGARLTSQVTLAGRFLVLVPSGGMTGVSRKLSERERNRLKSIVSRIAPKDMGVIIRTAAEGASEEALTKDLQNLTRQWERVSAKRSEFLHGKRPKLLQGEPDVAIRVVRDIFNDDFSKLIVEGDRVYERIAEYLDTMAPDLKDKLERWDPGEHEGRDVFDKWQIDSQLRKGMERQVYLPSGGSIVIDRTEAMTTVDVNTGRFIGKGKSLEETVTRCNLEASEEIARQLRLRDIGGMIMIDYVDMVMPANRDLVLRRLVECLARDRTKHQVAEVTSLGLVQMTRKRVGQGLVEAFSEECPTCKGRGFILHDEPTISSDYADPYAMKGGDPFVKTNKHGHGAPEVQAPKGSSPDVKAKLAQIAAAAVAANVPMDDKDSEGDDE
ncbi:MAG: Rne/Rng family ribonuclease [Bifidobacterium subtile]|nr:Rne/Rng family ribonuclease [Bifidobacterium subtile]MCI1241623.1 Rne/Rng family ribonuclease [Bifidobacterium subtile]MCI1258421.1 Rne/Rng family ribonuclease [Bifidobacterium subtile]